MVELTWVWESLCGAWVLETMVLVVVVSDTQLLGSPAGRADPLLPLLETEACTF